MSTATDVELCERTYEARDHGCVIRTVKHGERRNMRLFTVTISYFFEPELWKEVYSGSGGDSERFYQEIERAYRMVKNDETA